MQKTVNEVILNVEPQKESDDFNCYETMILMKNDSKPLKILIRLFSHGLAVVIAVVVSLS